MIVGTGTRRGTVEIPYGLNDRNEPIFEGLAVPMGRPQRSERIKREYDRYCMECGGNRSPHGVYTVSVIDYYLFGFRVYRSVDIVSFICLSCLHEQNPVDYPHGGLDIAERKKSADD